MNKKYYIVNNIPWKDMFSYQDRANFVALGYPGNIWQLDDNAAAAAWAQSKGAQEITQQQAENILNQMWVYDSLTKEYVHPQLSNYQV